MKIDRIDKFWGAIDDTWNISTDAHILKEYLAGKLPYADPRWRDVLDCLRRHATNLREFVNANTPASVKKSKAWRRNRKRIVSVLIGGPNAKNVTAVTYDGHRLPWKRKRR